MVLKWLKGILVGPAEKADDDYEIVIRVDTSRGDEMERKNKAAYEEHVAENRKQAILQAQVFMDQSAVILDTETTGLGKTDQVVELACVDVEGNVLLESLVKATCPISNGAREVNGISDSDLTELDIFPELRLDYTIDKACADSILANYSYSGTVERINQQREVLEILFALPTRYMDDDHIYELTSIMDNNSDDVIACNRSRVALETFRRVRNSNPMGQWREDTLEYYWPCTYPGEGFRLLNDGYSYNEDKCSTLLSWMPESWKPSGLRGTE